MAKEKVIKKGTVVKMHYNCNFAGCNGYDEITLDEDMTEDELNDMATEMAIETVQPEGWFEISEEGDDE